jgi:tRNA pseudouridine38-40 synthase
MPSFKITLAYDGTGFVGWQRQASGSSIQGLLEDILHELDNRPVTVIGAGRTDAGVHATGQVASVSLDLPLSASALAGLLNARLPGEVRVLSAEEVPSSFHARFDARAKTYRYRIWNVDVVSPFERRYAWHVPGRLDVGAMAAGASVLVGRHDFVAFQGAGSMTHTTERFVSSSRVVGGAAGFVGDAPGIIVYEISGDGFLRHMVRNVVGSLVEVGRGRRSAEWIGEVLAGRDRSRAGPTAPARGLFLTTVEYGERTPPIASAEELLAKLAAEP